MGSWKRGFNELCRQHPTHREVPAVLAKIWLIGRSYAAAIERRRGKDDQNDNFYVESVAPAIIRSDIDAWIESVEKHKEPDEQSIDAILVTHARTTQLFREISRL